MSDIDRKALVYVQGKYCGIPVKTAGKLIDRFIAQEDSFEKQIQGSLLSEKMTEDLLKLLAERTDRLRKGAR